MSAARRCGRDRIATRLSRSAVVAVIAAAAGLSTGCTPLAGWDPYCDDQAVGLDILAVMPAPGSYRVELDAAGQHLEVTFDYQVPDSGQAHEDRAMVGGEGWLRLSTPLGIRVEQCFHGGTADGLCNFVSGPSEGVLSVWRDQQLIGRLDPVWGPYQPVESTDVSCAARESAHLHWTP